MLQCFMIIREAGTPHIVELSEPDFAWACQWRWAIKRSRPKAGGSERKPYAYRTGRRNGKRTSIWLHKEIAERELGPPPTKLRSIADHLNSKPLDCKRGNFRWATPKMNRKNIGGIAAKKI